VDELEYLPPRFDRTRDDGEWVKIFLYGPDKTLTSRTVAHEFELTNGGSSLVNDGGY
jgi:hypothetical protein